MYAQTDLVSSDPYRNNIQQRSKFSLVVQLTNVLQAHNDLIRQLRGDNLPAAGRTAFQVVASQSFNDELTSQLDVLKEEDVR